MCLCVQELFDIAHLQVSVTRIRDHTETSDAFWLDVQPLLAP